MPQPTSTGTGTATGDEPDAGPQAITASWKAPSASSFIALAAATTAGDEAAIAYAEAEEMNSAGAYTQTRIWLQRLDGAGATLGAPVELGVLASGTLSGLTLATDGDEYMACWADASQIACATAFVRKAASATDPVLMPGRAPALAYNAGTWALAYGIAEQAYTTPAQLAIVKLTGDGLAAGSPTLFDAGTEPYSGMIPLLAPTKLGFVLAGGEQVRVRRLDLDLLPVGDPVDLGTPTWFFGAIAASETTVAINLAVPYGSNTFLLDGAAPPEKQPYGGGGKTGLRVALVAEGASFGMLSSADDAGSPDGLVYRSVAPGIVPVAASVLSADHRYYGGAPAALLRLKGETLLAVTQRNPGEEIIVARLPRP